MARRLSSHVDIFGQLGDCGLKKIGSGRVADA
jgi:hypothetical protein